MGKSKGKLKASKNGSSRLTAEEPADYSNMPLLFSLERIQSGAYCLSSLDKDHKAAFADAMFKRKALTWNEIHKSNRHGLGYEKIPVSSIKVTLPKFITDDQTHLLAFRFNGLKPMVGYRTKNVFYVLWFDHDFSLYNHGS